MKYIERLILLAFVIYEMGCVSAPTEKNLTSVVDAKVKVQMKDPERKVAAVSEDEFKISESCVKMTANIKQRWDWRQAVAGANTCLRTKDLLHAEEIGSELSLREPTKPWGPFFLASVARERKEYDRAIWMSELALKRAPDIAITHYLKAQILWNKKDFSPSVASFETSVELDPALLPAHLFLASIYFRDQNYAQASKHYAAVLKVEPRHLEALLGFAESQLQDSNSRGALESYKLLAAYYPKDGQYLEHIAEIYENNLGDSQQALTTYRTLRDQIRASKILLNVDKQVDSKIKELELALPKVRATASADEKGKLVQ